MIEKAKTYLVEVVLKKMTNAGVQSAISALVALLLSQNNMLETFGITTFEWGKWPYPNQPPVGMVTTIEWGTMTKGSAVTLAGLTVFVIAWIQHHSVAAVTGKPQSGDVRVNPLEPVAGGERKTDPPKEI